MGKYLVLWDIDRTLLSIGSVSHEIYAQAFSLVTGEPLEKLADMAGRTERAIIADTLALHQIPPTQETVTAFYQALGTAAQALQARMTEVGSALPGARAAIEALAKKGCVQSVVTGNIYPIAVAKLAAFDLATGLELDSGGYGDHSTDRTALVRSAIEATSKKTGVGFTPRDTVIIGDTPHDITGAHTAGAKVLAVATGGSSREELLAAGADAVLDDLADTTAVVTLVATLTSDEARAPSQG